MRYNGQLIRTAAVMLGLCTAVPLLAQYSAQQQGEVVRLQGAKSQTLVSIITSVGNEVFEMKVKGENILFFPFSSVDEFKSHPRLSGIPFLGPWANRLDEDAFYANGKRYPFNMELGNVRGAHPIHGFLSAASQWKVVEVKADSTAAWVTSKLEFFREPQWMAQFPFAHSIEMTHRLHNGVLEVRTKVVNLSSEPMPVSIGFHPYYRLTDSTRDEWTVNVGARSQWLLNSDKIPTGVTEPIEKLLPNPQAVALKDFSLDHVFGDLIRDADGRASVSVQGKSQKIEILLGPNYKALVIFAPGAPSPGGNGPPQQGQAGPPFDRNFIALEPMAGITDAMNLAHKGIYKELQSIAPGQAWEESFWVRPSGF